MATTATKEKPILFSGEMVRAILAGQKTQTRRVVKWDRQSSGLPATHLHDFSRAWVDPGFPNEQGCYRNAYLKVPYAHPEDGWQDEPQDDTTTRVYCPYGFAGDRLWVRETFYIDDIDYLTGLLPKDMPVSQDQIYYAADGTCCEQIPECSCGEVGKPKWRPSIFMPRWASRITLEITDVRVERVQDITEEDAKAEGVKGFQNEDGTTRHIDPFRVLWNQINAKRGYGWEVNPWVWSISFKRV